MMGRAHALPFNCSCLVKDCGTSEGQSLQNCCRHRAGSNLDIFPELPHSLDRMVRTGGVKKRSTFMWIKCNSHHINAYMCMLRGGGVGEKQTGNIFCNKF